jgi:hypothetical protein
MQNGLSTSQLRHLSWFLALPMLLGLIGCQGVTAANKATNNTATAGQLSVSPATMSFGTVDVGANSVKQGTLTAASADIIVTSAAWNGQGYSLSGITFPVTIPSGQSIPFTVTFAPQAAGNASGSITFDSDATDSAAAETLTGSGTQTSQHSVSLSWNASTSQVIGYNIYRRIGSSGSYTRLNPSINAITSYTDTSVQSGQTYDYVTTAVDASNMESAYSNEATAAIP